MATSINLRNSVRVQFHKIERIENKLNANLISKMNKIALIPDLQEIVSTTTQQILDLQARPTIAESNAQSTKNLTKVEVKLAALKKINRACDRIYHKCMTAKLSVLNQIFIDTNEQPHSKTREKQYETLIEVKNELIFLSHNSQLNEREKQSITTLFDAIEKLIPSLNEPLGKDLSEVSMDIEKPLENEDLSFSNKGQFTLSEEILVYLLSFLSGEDLIHLSRCNNFFHRICEDEFIWGKILQKEFPSLCNSDNKSAKKVYFSQKMMIHGLKNGLYTCSTLIQEETRIKCFGKDGNLIFLGLDNNTITIWDVTDPTNVQCIATLNEHEKSIAFLHKKNELLFSGSFDSTIKVWDLTDPTNIQCIATLRGHLGPIAYLLKQDSLLFSASQDDTIKIWDLSNLTKIRCIATLKEHTLPVRCLQKKDNLLFSGSGDVTIKIWDLSNLKNIPCIATLKKHKLTINCLHVDDNLLISGSNDNTIQIWDLSDLNNIEYKATLSTHETGIRCLKKEGNLLFSGSEDNAIKVWDLTKNQCIHSLKGHVNGVFHIIKEGNLLFSASYDNTIKTWNLNVSLEDTLLNLLDLINQEKIKIFLTRVQNLSPLIRNQIYTEFSEIHIFENIESAERAFLEIERSKDIDEKKIQAISRCLLKQVITLFKNNDSQKAMEIFHKLPQEIKIAVSDEFIENNGFYNDTAYIEAIKQFLDKTSIRK